MEANVEKIKKYLSAVIQVPAETPKNTNSKYKQNPRLGLGLMGINRVAPPSQIYPNSKTTFCLNFKTLTVTVHSTCTLVSRCVSGVR